MTARDLDPKPCALGTRHACAAVEGEPLFHASLDPDPYEELLETSGFVVEAFSRDDADCGHHTIWLARYEGD